MLRSDLPGLHCIKYLRVDDASQERNRGIDDPVDLQTRARNARFQIGKSETNMIRGISVGEISFNLFIQEGLEYVSQTPVVWHADHQTYDVLTETREAGLDGYGDNDLSIWL